MGNNHALNAVPTKARYVGVLAALTLLFSTRVLGQLAQYVAPIRILPPFDAWQGSDLSYPVLLSLQIAILFIAVYCTAAIAKGRLIPDASKARGLYLLGGFYFLTMLLRLALGLTLLRDMPWFSATISAFFHLVLAAMLLTLAHYHSSPTQRTRFRSVMRWTAYPGITALVLFAYYGGMEWGLPPGISSYLAGLVAAISITIAEILLPYRREWRPTRRDIAHDSVFLLLVQVALPSALTLIAALGLQRWVAQTGIALTDLWPHGSPIWVQMLLMMFIADFFRYWLHRAFHTSHRMWAIHAVHHSVQKLYWLNVGRFHPVDKSLQFLADVLPFILLGVTEEVLTLYFAIYSVKGFFQHSNVDVKLGWLNYIISGPELHRWHHSKLVRESNNNYGNNVSVWDWVFGSFYYPKAAEVQELGLFNRNYPMDFMRQMRAPFIRGLDKKDPAHE